MRFARNSTACWVRNVFEHATAARQLAQSTCSVLEMMCSLATSPAGLSEESRARLRCVQVGFTGPVCGRMLIAADEGVAEMLAPAFLMLGGDQAAPDAAPAVLAEIANIVCGAMVTGLQPDGLFSISSPSPLASLPRTDECLAEVGIDCGCGSLVVQLQIAA